MPRADRIPLVRAGGLWAVHAKIDGHLDALLALDTGAEV
jgi:hypothetical protein